MVERIYFTDYISKELYAYIEANEIDIMTIVEGLNEQKKRNCSRRF